jgi:Ca2+/Na+ antiporter
VDRELAVLVADYTATREDHRQSAVRDVALVSAGIAIFAAYFYLVSEQPGFLQHLPVVVAILPLAPYMIGVTFAIQAVENVLRGYYIRSLERAIQERVEVASALGDGIRFPSFGHLTYALYSVRFGSRRVTFLWIIAWVATIAVYCGAVAIALSMLPTIVDAVAVGVLHAGLAVALLWTLYTTTVRPRRFFLRTFAAYRAVRTERLDQLPVGSSPHGPHAGRSGWSYLALPRIAELVKWGVFVLTWAAATMTVGIVRPYDSAELTRAVGLAGLALLIFEYLVYQARYQWNDLRGAEQDRDHAAAQVRARLPEGFERASLAILVLRVALAAYLTHLAFRGTDLLMPAYLVIAVPFLVAIPYEELRRRSDHAPADFAARPRAVHRAIYTTVGLGFATRAVLGVLVGTLFVVDWAFLGLFFVASALAASADTVSGWAIESAVERARGGTWVRPHVAVLHRYIEQRVAETTPDATEQTVRSTRYLRDCDVLPSPWVSLHLASVAVASLAGLVLGALLQPTPGGVTLAIGFVVGWTAVAAALKLIHTARAVVLLLVVTAVVMATIWVIAPGLAVAAALPPAGILMINLFNRSGNFEEYNLGARAIGVKVARATRAALRAFLRWAFGHRAASILFGHLVANGRPSAGGQPPPREHDQHNTQL